MRPAMVRADLVMMANQIAANFAHHPPDSAAREVADHLVRYWTPAMRAELAASGPGDGLSPIAQRAASLLRDPTVSS